MPIDPAKPFDLCYTVDPNWEAMRLDRYVHAMVPAISRSRIQTYIKRDRVTVNGECRTANWKVRIGDEVVLKCNIPEEGADAGKKIQLDILYEDDDIIAINKQAGLLVHPVSINRHNTLLNALYWRYKDVLPEHQEISLVNRLDQFTSGVVLATKHTRAKQIMQDQFEDRIPKKTYVALCRGIIEQDSGTVDLPLGPAANQTDKCKIGVRHDEEGKPCLTQYEVIERFMPDNAPHLTYVKLSPHTGRQHQLRVHMLSIGHPLVGDDRYGPIEELYQQIPDGYVRLCRYALHARTLKIIHPLSGEEMFFDAPVAKDITSALEGLRADMDGCYRPLENGRSSKSEFEEV